MSDAPKAVDAIEAAVERYLDQLGAEGKAAAEATLAAHPESGSVRARLALLERIGLLGDSPPKPAMPLQIGGYRVLRMLGRGGMGVVWLAESLQGGEAVALKCLRSDVLADDAAVARFRREVHAIASLRDDGIVELIDAGVENGTPWLAMTYVEGPSLQQLLQALRDPADSGPSIAALLAQLGVEPAAVARLPQRRTELAIELVRQAAVAVGHAHERGHVHRDLKPGNLLLRRDGRVVVLDFGLSIQVTAPHVTATGAFVGSPSYSAPEMLHGKALEALPTLDVFALGITLCELLTGVHPYAGEGDTTVQLDARVDTRAFERLARHLPRDVVIVCMKAIDALPSRRYANAGSLAADLKRLLAFEPIEARAPGLPTRIRRAVRRRPVLAAVALTALPFGIFEAWYSWSGLRNQRDEARALVSSLEKSFDYLDFLLASSDPSRSGGHAGIQPYVLDQAAAWLRAETTTDNDVRARVAISLAARMLDVGHLAGAETVIDTAIAAASAEGDTNLQALAEAERGRLLLLRQSPDAIPILEHALAVLRQDMGHPSRAWRTELMVGLALMPSRMGDGEVVLAALADRLEMLADPEAASVSLEALLALARHHGRSDRCTAARRALARAKAVLARIKEPLPTQSLAVDRVAAMLAGTMGEHGEALELLRACVARLTVLHRDENHPAVLAARKELFDELHRAGDLHAAVLLGDKLLAAMSPAQDELSGDLNEVRIVQAKVLLGLDRPQEALVLCRQCHAFMTRWAAREHRDVDPCGAGDTLWQVGLAEAACGDRDAAAATLGQALAHYERISDDQARNCFLGRARLAAARVQRREDRGEEAIATARAALAELWWATPILPEDYLDCLEQLRAWSVQVPGSFDELLRAELDRLRPRVAKLAAEGLPQSRLRLARHRLVVGLLAGWSGSFDVAIGALESAVPVLEDTIGPHHRQTRAATTALVAVRDGRTPPRMLR